LVASCGRAFVTDTLCFEAFGQLYSVVYNFGNFGLFAYFLRIGMFSKRTISSLKLLILRDMSKIEHLAY
jgi:hypothetical protein